MAWESGIGYNAAVAEATREALEQKDVEWLATAIANDRYARTFHGWKERYQRCFEKWVGKLSRLPHDVLVDECMRRAERTNAADNGGWAVWIDKDGCSKLNLTK